MTERKTLPELEYEIIVSRYNELGRNITHTAKSLGVSSRKIRIALGGKSDLYKWKEVKQKIRERKQREQWK